MINYKTLDVNRIIQLDNNERSIPLIEKLVKLGEEIGEMSVAKLYLTNKEYVEETYDAFNIAVAVYNTIKENRIDIETLESIINKAEPDNKLENAIPIYFGKMCASLLFRMDSNSKSRTTNNTDLESYSFELITLLVSQLKYIYRDNIDFEVLVKNKLDKWEIKQEHY